MIFYNPIYKFVLILIQILFHCHTLTKNISNFARDLLKKMKPGLAVLPLEVWADIFLSPWFTRQELAQILNETRNRNFANKLNKLLHDCGKPTLDVLNISSKFIKEISNRQAILEVGGWLECKECKFPECEMPENIKRFKQLTIEHLDDQVLDFLDKLKPLFNNVLLQIQEQSATLLTHFLPMVASIRRIGCYNDEIEFLEQHFPGKLAQAKELELCAKLASIPTYLNWLNTPLDLNLHGPRFLWAIADSKTIFAIIAAVRMQFLTATTSSAFVIFLQFNLSEQHLRADKSTIENAATKEKLAVRNASFKTTLGFDTHYVEILRHPIGADAKMREWINKEAYYEKKFNGHDKENTVIWIYEPTIGRITKEAIAMKQDENESEGEENEAGPSTSAAKKMKK